MTAPGMYHNNLKNLPDEPMSRIVAKHYKALGTQFGVFVLISTFNSALIVSFLSFAHDAMDLDSPYNQLMFEIGMLFSLLAIGFHLGVIIVGGRATSLCFRLSVSTGSTTDDFRESLKKVDFTRYVTYCERLQLIGTMLLLHSILFTTFFMFSRLAFPIILAAASGLGAISVYRTDFWSVSVLRETFMHLVTRRPTTQSKELNPTTYSPDRAQLLEAGRLD